MKYHQLFQYPLGNADCTLVRTADGRLILVDCAAVAGSEPDDLRIDLPRALREDIGSRQEIDALVLTHLDQDHYRRVTELFRLGPSPGNQVDSRTKVRQLCVPAAAIVDEGLESAEARVIQQEARSRLRQGSGIRVISCPRTLVRWMRREGLNPKDREHLITHAGTCLPEFSLARDGLEVFVHAPFADAAESKSEIERNETSVVLHLTFSVGGCTTRVFLAADVECEDLARIVLNSERSGNQNRLLHNVVKLPHHLSYGSLSRDKGVNQTEPLDPITRFYEQYGQPGVILIGSSKVVEPGATDGPPHPEAVRYYESVAARKGGEFLVTMEFPTKTAPDRLILDIGPTGVSIIESRSPGGIRKSIAPVVIVPAKPGPPSHPRVVPRERPSKPWAEIRPTDGSVGISVSRSPGTAAVDRSQLVQAGLRRLRDALVPQMERVQERFPNLSLTWRRHIGFVVSGTLDFVTNYGGCDIRDQYRLEIWILGDYPESVPIVFELDGRVDRSFNHFMSFGNLCLGAPIEVRMKFARNPTLIRFLEDLVVPYLASWSHLRDHGRLPFGELAHGGRGLLEYFGEVFGTNRYSTLGLLAHLADGSPEGVRRCPCGSGRRFEGCHANILRQMQRHLYPMFENELKEMIAHAREVSWKLPRSAVPAKFRKKK